MLRADLLEHGDRFRLSVSDQLQLPGLYASKYVWPANLSPVYDPLPFGAIHRIYVGLGVGVMLAWITLLVRWFSVVRPPLCAAVFLADTAASAPSLRPRYGVYGQPLPIF